jgi:hypothetical protein
MINCFQFCFNFAYSFNLRRYMKAVMGVLRTHQAGRDHMLLTITTSLKPKPSLFESSAAV